MGGNKQTGAMSKTEEGIINVGYYVTKFIDRDLDFDLYI
jgi:hypothetical protein